MLHSITFYVHIVDFINNTDFIVIGNKERGLTRMSELLKTFGLDDRLVTKDKIDKLQYGKLEKINWQKVNNKLDDLKKHSADWLLKALG